MYKKGRKYFYKNLNIKDLLDNRKFWKNVKPLFSNKNIIGQKITVVKGKEIISEDRDVAETLNTFSTLPFSNSDVVKYSEPL